MCSICCYHSNIQIATKATELLTYLAIHKDRGRPDCFYIVGSVVLVVKSQKKLFVFCALFKRLQPFHYRYYMGERSVSLSATMFLNKLHLQCLQT